MASKFTFDALAQTTAYVDFTQSGAEKVNEVAAAAQCDFVTRLGFEQLLTVRQHA